MRAGANRISMTLDFELCFLDFGASYVSHLIVILISDSEKDATRRD